MHASRALLAALLILGGSIWTGGLVAIVVVARISGAVLPAPARVALFRGIGRAYGIVAGGALTVSLLSGALLLRGLPWSGALTATVVLAAGLLGTTAVGVIQARRMSRLRQAAIQLDAGDQDDQAIRAGARIAVGLRATIAVLTLALVAMAAVLDT
ncbi:MAG TPA: hypothetical protein VI138_01985 [Candidatus Dormibacteraeota bacterium]